MKKLVITPGTVFGDLTVVAEMEKQGVHRRFHCRTADGREMIVRLDRLLVKKEEKWSLPKLLEFKGKKQTIKEWAEELGINEVALRSRLRRMGPAEALGMGGSDVLRH